MPARLSTRARILCLLSAAGVFMVLGVLALKVNEHKSEEVVQAAAAQQQLQLAREVLRSEGELSAAFVDSYSWWTEMANFVRKPKHVAAGDERDLDRRFRRSGGLHDEYQVEVVAEVVTVAPSQAGVRVAG